MKKIIIGTGFIAVLFLGFYACKKDQNIDYVDVTVKLIDAPSQYDEVKVEVIGMELHQEDSGWYSISVTDSIYDLLLLQDSANATLGNVALPSGKISQIRLILGTQNTVTISGVSYPLTLSSEDETGLKLNVHQDILSGVAYTLTIDFDAAQSIVEEGNGTYKLKPVLSAEFI